MAATTPGIIYRHENIKQMKRFSLSWFSFFPLKVKKPLSKNPSGYLLMPYGSEVDFTFMLKRL
jgi:hypothetical protein